MKECFKSWDKERAAAHEFFKLMAVCHSVVIDVDKKTGKENLQASSPDELALVSGSKEVGYQFKEKTSRSITLKIDHTK